MRIPSVMRSLSHWNLINAVSTEFVGSFPGLSTHWKRGVIKRHISSNKHIRLKNDHVSEVILTPSVVTILSYRRRI